MEKKDHEFCLRCGRKLKNPVARERGYGLICYQKMKMVSGRHLFNSGISAEVKIFSAEM